MKYQSMKALNAKYGDRSVLDYERHVQYIKDCFDTIESLGFAETFNSPYDENERFNGLKFDVVGRVPLCTDDVDLEVLPMWNIVLENGKKLVAYPEEICDRMTEEGDTRY